MQNDKYIAGKVGASEESAKFYLEDWPQTLKRNFGL